MSEQATVLIAEDDAGTSPVEEPVPTGYFHSRRRGTDAMPDGSRGEPIVWRNFVLLDLRLPRIDGSEVLERIKADPELCKIPVIVLTTSQDEADVNRCYELGCSAYVTKPLDYTAFMETVEALGAVLSLPEFAWPRIHSDQIRSRIE